MPARAAIGLPPNVAACMPGRKLGAISAVVISAAPATPPHKLLASVMTSGVTPAVLVGKPLAGPPAAALHFVEHQQQIVLIGQFAQALQKSIRRNADAAFALHRLDQDRARLAINELANGVQIAIRRVHETGQAAGRSLRDISAGPSRSSRHTCGRESRRET